MNKSAPKRINKYMLDDELQALIGKAANSGNKISFADLDSNLQLIIDNAGKGNSSQDELSSYASIYADVVKRLNKLEQNTANFFNKAEDKITPQMLPASITETFNNMASINDKASLDYVKKTYETKADADQVHGRLNDMLQNLQSKVNTLTSFDAASLAKTEATKAVQAQLPAALSSYALKTELNNYMSKSAFTKTDVDSRIVFNEACFSQNIKNSLNAINNFNPANYLNKTQTDGRYRKKDELIGLADMDESLQTNMKIVVAQAESVAGASYQTVINMYNGAVYGSTWFKNGDQPMTISADLDNKYGNMSSWYAYPGVAGQSASTDAAEATLYNTMNAAQKRDIKTQYIYPYRFAHLAAEFADTFTMGNEGALKVTRQNGEQIPLVSGAKMTPVLLCNYLYNKIRDIASNYDTISAYVTARIGSGITGTVKDYVDSKTKISSLRSSFFGTTKISKSELDTNLQGKIDTIGTNTSAISANANAIAALEARVAALEAKVK